MTPTPNKRCHKNSCLYHFIRFYWLIFIFLFMYTEYGWSGQTPFSGANPNAPNQVKSIEDDVASKTEKEALFQRKGNLLVFLSFEQISQELSEITRQVRLLASGEFWKDESTRIFSLGAFLPVSSLVLYGIILLLVRRFRGICEKFRENSHILSYPARSFAIQMFYLSFPLFGSTLFFYVYTQAQSLYASTPFIRMGVGILWTFLATRWFIDFFDLLLENNIYPGLNRFFPRIRVTLLWVRYLVVANMIVAWMIGQNSVVLFFGRSLFETGLLLWQLNFSKRLKAALATPKSTTRPRLTAIKPFVYFFWFLIPGGALLLDLSGYGSLAVYWLSSVMQSATVFLWGGIFFFVLREWYVGARNIPEVETEGDKVTGNPFKWVIMCLCWLAWAGFFISFLIIAWGGRQTIILGFFKALNYPVIVGSMQFRMSGFIYAFLTLMFTHAAVKIWRRLVKDKILNYSGLDIGLQESISTIAVYIIWTIGILTSLHAFGINATSMTVALGALGIGLGFGLQNIFNNFVSGIILLFERPIQVGDAIEINGIWASVRKINVRSTVVQTWDNASLIIPNSEFISSQVTNWSFKDMRVRRNINVGVAYGSDTELVRKTLIEIAAGMPNVLKNPNPDVLFTDFGDSALIFRLRVWTLVDHMLTVETNIRFEIDRLFRERDITIAFPQRDIHIRSIVKQSEEEIKSNRLKDDG